MNAIYLQAFDGTSGQIGCGHNGAFEALFGRFLQALFTVGYRAYLPGKSNFAKYYQIVWQWPVAK